MKINWLFELSCIFNGGKWTQEKQDRARIQYAKDNPWVLRYDFGHKELIEYQHKFEGKVI